MLQKQTELYLWPCLQNLLRNKLTTTTTLIKFLLPTKLLNPGRSKEPQFLFRKRKTAILCLVAGCSWRALNHSECRNRANILSSFSRTTVRADSSSIKTKTLAFSPLSCCRCEGDACCCVCVLPVPITMQRGGRCRQMFYSCRSHQSVNKPRKIVRHPSYVLCTGGVQVSAHDD